MPEAKLPPWLGTVKAFLLDMDGTLVLGEQMLHGAEQFIDVLRSRGIPYLILTNNSSKDARDYVQHLQNVGLPISEGQVYTSGDATIAFLKEHHPGSRVYLVGTPALARQFKRMGIRLTGQAQAEVIAVGFDTTLTYEKLKTACELVRAELPYIATHPDLNCPTAAGPVPDVGAVIAFIRASTGRFPDHVIGKPNWAMIQSVERFLGHPAQQMCMVGDRLYTDIALGRHGIRTILVLSGETDEADLRQAQFKPDLVVKDVLALSLILREMG